MLVALAIIVIGALLVFIPWAWHKSGLDKDKQYREQSRKYWDKFSDKDWRAGRHIDMAKKPGSDDESK